MFSQKKPAEASVYATSLQSSRANYLQPRQIQVNIPLPPEQLDPRQYGKGRYVPKTVYCSNQIRTSKYTVFTFLPKNLFEQFRRVANTFFLLLVVLQAFPEYETVNIGVAATPIIIIVCVTAVKDGFEDYKRWKSDTTVNERTSSTLRGSWRNLNYRTYQGRTWLQRIMRPLERLFRSFSGGTVSPGAAELTAVTTSDSVETPPQWQATQWHEIRVGDIIKLHNDEPIPADILVLASSEPDCICYVETKNLDGETNLKLRQGSMDTAWATTPTDYSNRIKMIVESEPPGTHMLRYQALITVFGSESSSASVTSTQKTASVSTTPTASVPSTNILAEHQSPSASVLMSQMSTKKIPVDINGILFRGAVLRNTEWVLGVVVFTGEDTKQIMNSGKTPSKQSNVDKVMNPHVATNLTFLMMLCAVCAFGYPLWYNSFDKESSPFLVGLEIRQSLAWEGFVNFWAGLILFQNIVPISLYISIEIVKTIQAYFIHEDLQLYYEESDTRCQPRSWNLSDNLGQIEYIFSDKTGTLTRNIMEFKKCSIGGRVYDGSGGNAYPSMGSEINTPTTPRPVTLSRNPGATRSMFAFTVVESSGGGGSQAPKSAGVESEMTYPDSPRTIDRRPVDHSWERLDRDEFEGGWHDEALDRYLRDPKLTDSSHRVIVNTFFTLLSLCHTVLVDEKLTDANAEKAADQPKTISYKAQSPDEACLVTVAAETGFVFKGRVHRAETGQNEMCIDVLGQEQRFELLNILEFDSDRKRMSIIVRPVVAAGLPRPDVLLFCKGADNVIIDRLAPGQDVVVSRTSRHLQTFAGDGLRTLCLAYRRIPPEEFDQWAKRCGDAMATIYPDGNARNREMEVLNNEVEQGLTLLGATAIEDKLQDGVPECITTLADAGIKIWVLTGDKVETAINVGFLCGLLKNVDSAEEGGVDLDAEMILIQIKDVLSAEEMGRQLNAALTKFWGPSAVKIREKQEYALIIDGQSLKFALETDEMKAALLDVGCRCKAVVCCRVSPLQKAKVVELVKFGKKVMTLAIGDGANDVSMIQAADVGVGINGEEGLQAAMSADYAIAQFRFLTRLLLVHGSWSYTRISNMILNFYLKSMVFSMVVFWFQFYSGFSAAVIYEFTYMLFYNLVFTCLPIMVLAIFDQSLSDQLCVTLPRVYYSQGISQTQYTDRKFARYFAESIWHSLVCFFVPYLVYSDGTLFDGTDVSSLYLGTLIALSAIVMVNLSVALDTKAWTWMSHVTIWGSCLVFAVYIMIFSLIPDSSIYGMVAIFYTDPTMWLTFAMALMLGLGPRYTYYYVQRVWYYTDQMVAEEIQQLITAKKLTIDEVARQMMHTRPKSPSPLRPKQQPLDDSDRNGLPPRIDTTGVQLHRKLSNASTNSISFEMSNGESTVPNGFSFSHTKGMGSVILRSPMSMLSARGGGIPRSFKEMRRGPKSSGSASSAVATGSGGVIEKTIKLNPPKASAQARHRVSVNSPLATAAGDNNRLSSAPTNMSMASASQTDSPEPTNYSSAGSDTARTSSDATDPPIQPQE